MLCKSTSGGVFAGIALKLLEMPGASVFGCAFDENNVARHICVDDAKLIASLQSSKYVQSDVGDTYLHAKVLLSEGKTVFYTGTPCQIAGLYAFLGRDYDNLLTADLICHGVPSPLLFRRYLDWLGRKNGGEISYYGFRSREKSGWGLMAKIVVMTKKKSKTRRVLLDADPYYRKFIEACTIRECCYNCQYANSRRVADLTFGDFWGAEKLHPEFYDSRGISVLLINTTKGDRFFGAVLDRFSIIETTLEKAVKKNQHLSKPSPRPVSRDLAYKNITDEDTDIFRSQVFKISKVACISVYLRAAIKRVSPQMVIRLYRKIRH